MRYALLAVQICSIVLTASAGTLEETILTDYSDTVFRPDSMTLCIVTAEQDTLVFTDTPHALRGGDAYKIYSVSSYLPEQNYWTLWITGYEWTEWLMINGDNGREYLAISSPTPSPDGQRLLTGNWDDAWFLENGIQIWRIDADSLVLEFSDLELPWDPVRANWTGDSVVVFKKQYCDWGTREITFLPGRLELSSDGTWIPDDPESWE